MEFGGHRKETILSCLGELSSAEEQARLWLSDGSSGEVSSFTEAFECLFTDMDIVNFAQSGSMGPANEISTMFRELELLMQRVDYRLSDQEKIIHPSMAPVRQKALDIISRITDHNWGC